MPSDSDLALDFAADYLDAVAAGEPVDLAAICAARADLIPQVESLLRDGGHFAKAAGELAIQSDVDAEPMPETLGRYQLMNVLGEGGMGIAFRGRDPELNRDVAVKLLRARVAHSPNSAKRFLDEARITAQLQHPTIPAVHELGTHPDGRPWMAMKLIKGDTLAALLATNSQSLNRFTVFESICQGLSYAHSKGVIHRDLKPHNIMVGAFGEVQVMDWGLAKVLNATSEPESASDETVGTVIASDRDSDGEFTRAGTAMGSPAYMPPEQAIGAVNRIDRRSDVFGLGAILCHLLTGKPPFVGADPESTRQLAAMGKVESAFARLDASGADPEWVALCKRCLAPEQDDRPADAATVAAEVAGLRAAADERAKLAEVDKGKAEVTALEQKRRRRSRLAYSLSLLALAALGSTLAFSRYRALERQRRAEIETAIETLAAADPAQAPGLLGRLAEMGDEPLPSLRDKLATAEPNSRREVRMRLALLPHDRGQLDELKKRLYSVAVSEFPLLSEQLRPESDALVADLWGTLTSRDAANPHRFRAACLLAQYDEANPLWSAAATVVIDCFPLIGANELALWSRLLVPVERHLRSGIDRAVLSEADGTGPSGAAILFAEVPPERDAIVAMALRVSPTQLGEIVRAVRPHTDAVRPLLTAALEYPIPEKPAGKALDWEHQRISPAYAVRARAALLLLHLGNDAGAWARLRADAGQTRSYLIDWFHTSQFPLSRLIERFRIEGDLATRRAIVQAVGEYPIGSLSVAEQAHIRGELLHLFAAESDPGLHSSIEWLLRRWKHGAEVDAAIGRMAAREPTKGASWYANRAGQTFAVIRSRPVAFLGSPNSEFGREVSDGGETRRVFRIDREFAIGTTEVTIGQFRSFDPKHVACLPEYGYGPTPDCPLGHATLAEIRKYCRWLTEREGFAEADQCYPSEAEAKETGFVLYPDALLRKGYRLPTEAEWEYAARAGCAQSRHWGEDHGPLLDKYAISARIDTDRTYPVGERKPNDLGLFDTLGNVWEWCGDYHSHVRHGLGDFANPDWGGGLRSRDRFGVIRGGAFTMRALEIRTARRRQLPEDSRYADMGFRLARTLSVMTGAWEVKLYTGDLKVAPSPDHWKAIISRSPVRIAQLAELDFCYTDGGQDDHFALTAEKTHVESAGEYELSVLADDGVRVLVDGVVAIDHWGSNGVEPITKRVHLKVGSGIRVEYWQRDQMAQLQIRLTRK